MMPADVDAAVTRLFALLGVSAPRQGSVVFDFDDGKLSMVRPTNVIRIQREKTIEPRPAQVHTQQR